MPGVVLAGVPEDFAVDPGPAGDRRFPVLQDDGGRSLAEHEPAAAGVERPGRPLRRPVSDRKRADHVEGGIRQPGQRRLGRGGHRQVQFALADEVESQAERVDARGAAGGQRRARAAQPERARGPGRRVVEEDRVVEDGVLREGVDRVRSVLAEFFVGILELRGPADGRGEHDTRPVRIDPGQGLLACPGQAGVGRDHRAHGHAELREPAEPGKPGQVRGVVVPGQVELAGPGHDPAAQSDPLHQRLGAQAGQPRGVVPPELRLAHTARRDDADACDNDTVHAFPPTASG